MLNIVIIGTGAVAAEITDYLIDSNDKYNTNYNIVGYLEYECNINKYYKKYNFENPVVGDLDNFNYDKTLSYLIGVSNINFKKKIIKILEEKGVKPINFIHPSTIISKNVKIGVGNIIYPNCIIGPNTSIGDYNLMTSFSVISHDNIIGDNNFFATSVLCGNVTVGNYNFFSIRSTIIPNITIGNENLIQAGMIINSNIQDETTTFYRYKEKIIFKK